MAAGLGFKTFTTGEVLTAGDVNGYLMQGINVFASSAARASAITSPQEGQYSFLKDTNALEYYDGAAWVGAPVGDITAVTAGKGLTGGGSSGDVTVALATTAKGDLVAGSGASTAAVLTVGANDTVLTADSSTATGLKWATPSAGSTNVAGKNGVLNSNFSVWQRGTSFSLAASTGTTYIADRWCTQTGANQASVVSRLATSDTTNLPNIQYCLTYQRNSGQTGTGALSIMQPMETVNSVPFAGKTVTMSFYARAGSNYSATSNALAFYLRTGTGTDQNPFAGYTGDTLTINSTATLTTTWQRFTATATVPTTATEMTAQFTFTPTGTAGLNDYYQVTGVQVEVASSASAYSPNTPTYQAELAACQRYYFQDAKTTITNGYATNTYNNFDRYFHPVVMRTTPTITQTGAVSFSSNTSATTFTVDPNGSNEIATGFYFLTGASNGLTYLYRPVQWSAEL